MAQRDVVHADVSVGAPSPDEPTRTETVFLRRGAWESPTWTEESFTYTGRIDAQWLLDELIALLTAACAGYGGAVAYRRWAAASAEADDVWTLH
jgi:hypothetical protein